MASPQFVTLYAKKRWWLTYYISGVAWFAKTFRLEPNWSRVMWWVMKGMQIIVCDSNGRRIR